MSKIEGKKNVQRIQMVRKNLALSNFNQLERYLPRVDWFMIVVGILRVSAPNLFSTCFPLVILLSNFNKNYLTFWQKMRI